MKPPKKLSRTKPNYKPEMTAEDFEALPRRQRDRIIAEIDADTPEHRLANSRPLSAAERANWRALQKKLSRGRGRPRLGQGVAKVSLSVEKTLLDRADAFARSHNLNRSELVSQSLARFIAAG